MRAKVFSVKKYLRNFLSYLFILFLFWSFRIKILEKFLYYLYYFHKYLSLVVKYNSKKKMTISICTLCVWTRVIKCFIVKVKNGIQNHFWPLKQTCRTSKNTYISWFWNCSIWIIKSRRKYTYYLNKNK